MAENIIGLLMEINADPKKAEAAFAELKASSVAESTEISSIWSGAMDAVTGPIGIATGAVVGLGTAMFEAVDKVAEAGNSIYEASIKTGLGAEALSGLRVAAKELGENFDATVTPALARASRNIAALIDTGAGPLADLFTPAETNSLKLMPMAERIQTVTHRIFELNDVGERNRQLQALLGRGWEEGIEIWEKVGKEGFDPLIEKAKELNQMFGPDAVRQAHEYEKALNDMKTSLSGMWHTVGIEVLPAVTASAQFLENLFTKGFHGMADLADQGWEVSAGHMEKAAKLVTDADREASQAAKEAAAAQKKYTDEVMRSGDALGMHFIEAIKRNWEEIKKQGEALEKGAAVLQQKSIPALDNYDIGVQKFTLDLKALAATAGDPKLGPLLQLPGAYQGPASRTDLAAPWEALAASFKRAIPVMERLREEFTQLSAAELAHASIAKQVAAVVTSDTTAAMEASLAAIIGVIGGRKLQAEFEGAYYVAKGAIDLAEGIWPPNPALIAKGLGEIAGGAQMLQLVGRGAGAGGGSAGGSGASAAYNRGGGSGSAPGGGGPGSSGPGGGPVNHWHIYGPAFMGPDDWQTFINTQNQMTQRGIIAPVAANALTDGPKNT